VGWVVCRYFGLGWIGFQKSDPCPTLDILRALIDVFPFRTRKPRKKRKKKRKKKKRKKRRRKRRRKLR